jgi:hypothetical protein
MSGSSGLRSVTISSWKLRADTSGSLATESSTAGARMAAVSIMPAIVASACARRCAGSVARSLASRASAVGRTPSAVAPGGPNIIPMNGTMSTTISFDTAFGWRAASIIPIVPPIEWPITAGAFTRVSAM